LSQMLFNKIKYVILIKELANSNANDVLIFLFAYF